jgi:hypothetical protein
VSRCGVKSILGWQNSHLSRAGARRLRSVPLLRVRPFRHFGKIGKGSQLSSGHIDLDHASHQNGVTPNDFRGAPLIDIRNDAGVTSITVCGAIDASDIDELSPHARGLVRECGVLVVDLCGIDFIAVDGLRALLALWSADPVGTGLSPVRVLRICSEQFVVVLRRRG